MKAIVSHDVDHLTVWEHGLDGIIAKHVIRNFIEMGLGYVSLREVAGRLGDIGRNRWHNLELLMRFDREQAVPATFFFGVANGAGLRYSLANAASWIQKVAGEGFEVGVHGIAYNRIEDMRREYRLFKQILGRNSFGIRMHYLRMDENTLDLLDDVGYLFDSSVAQVKGPYRVGRLWEFPVHIMDGYVICGQARWQTRSLAESMEATKRIIEDAADAEIGYLTVDVHDRYFSASFRTWKKWYVWLIGYLQQNGIRFVSYRQALEELDADCNNGCQENA